MIFEQVKADGGNNFFYIIGDEETLEAAVVDPGFWAEQVIHFVESRGLKIMYIFNTHSHRDHTSGNETVAKRFGAKVVAHRSSGIVKDVPVDDGDTLSVGGVKFQIIHTPGHTPDSMCVLVDRKVMTGDTLSVGYCGRTDRGSSEDMYNSLFGKLMTLDDDIEVYPGHDYGPRPRSTIGEERRTNYALKERTLEEFIELLNEL